MSSPAKSAQRNAVEAREIFAAHVVKSIAVVSPGAPPIKLDLRDLFFNWQTGELSFAVHVPEATDEEQEPYRADAAALAAKIPDEPLAILGPGGDFTRTINP